MPRSVFQSRPRSEPRRRGFALIDVIVGGVMLGIGIAALISVTARSIAQQTEGEKQLVAAWLADELLNMVLVAGPVQYPKIHDTIGTFEAPFEKFQFEVAIQEQGPRQPLRVIAYVRWEVMRGEHEIAVETLIAARLEEEPTTRIPLDIIDREGRYFDDE